MTSTIKSNLSWFEIYTFELDFDQITKKIAWDLYCEISPCYGIVEFNENEDLIIKCLDSYDTCYELGRKLMKELEPPRKKKSSLFSNQRKYHLSEILDKLLLGYMRPYLQKWNHEFREYWESKRNTQLSLIEGQKAFPCYCEILSQTMDLQKKLRSLVVFLFQIASQ